MIGSEADECLRQDPLAQVTTDALLSKLRSVSRLLDWIHDQVNRFVASCKALTIHQIVD